MAGLTPFEMRPVGLHAMQSVNFLSLGVSFREGATTNVNYNIVAKTYYLCVWLQLDTNIIQMATMVAGSTAIAVS